MKTEIKTGSFVHVVATINKTAGDGKIMYVNPSVSTIASDAATDKDVELWPTTTKARKFIGSLSSFAGRLPSPTGRTRLV
ncbi:hypothetical protein ACQ5SK_33500 [Bradyrhizobium japonicum]